MRSFYSVFHFIISALLELSITLTRESYKVEIVRLVSFQPVLDSYNIMGLKKRRGCKIDIFSAGNDGHMNTFNLQSSKSQHA